MGTWGTAISSNDTYANIYSDFFYLYNDGLDVTEISTKLIDGNQETINDTDDCNNFWFALAKAQWECKQLNMEVLHRVTEIITTGADLEVWRQLGAGEKEVKQRKNVLDKFLAGLQTEKTKAKARKTRVIRQPVFEKGDCLTFKLENGNYGGAVILEAIKDSEYGYNLLVTTRINQPGKPTQKDFEDAGVLVVNYEGWNNKPAIQWYLPTRHTSIAHLIEKAGNMKVQIDYALQTSIHSYVADFDIWVIGVASQQFKWEATNPRSAITQTIKELTKKG